MLRRGRGRARSKLKAPLPATRILQSTSTRVVADISGDLKSGAASGPSTADTEPVAGPSRTRRTDAIYYSPIAADTGPFSKKQKISQKVAQSRNEAEVGSSEKGHGHRSDRTRKIVSSSERRQPPTEESSSSKKHSKTVTFASEQVSENEDEHNYNSLTSLRNLSKSKGKFLHSLRTVTKLKIPPPRKRTQTLEDPPDSFDFDTDIDTQESLEICQGFSKIKLHDWHPFFDMEYNKRNAPDVAATQTSAPSVGSKTASSSRDNQKTTDNGESDGEEWEETLVYVDLEDIPDVDGLLSSLAPRSSSVVDDVGLSHLEMKIYDMDSKLPVLQLGGRYLAGHWENAVGTSLFFKKKLDPEEEIGSNPSPASSEVPQSQTFTNSTSKLKSILSEPEIPFDPVYGENCISGEDGYELVAKAFSVLKARYFPVVSEAVKKDDILHNSDEEFDPRDFQIPPINMVRQYMTKDFDYEKYIEADINRRRAIREKWIKPEKKKKKKKSKPKTIIKSEPLEHDETLDESIEILDAHLDPFLGSINNSDFTPGTS
ncbi:unnamed protein product [Orchesella dallaii]|uniref:Transcription factor TFIIIC triple barrel domain-containing protein n=1 Tax=Orchesella dallaii TaxID=48710 RepID=A0ABP1QWU3_9HEXA